MGWGEGGRGSPAAMGATAKVKLPPLPLPLPLPLSSLILSSPSCCISDGRSC